MNSVCIPDYEYQERIVKAAAMMREKNLDVMLVCSTEIENAKATLPLIDLKKRYIFIAKKEEKLPQISI